MLPRQLLALLDSLGALGGAGAGDVLAGFVNRSVSQLVDGVLDRVLDDEAVDLSGRKRTERT